ncbi:MAG: Aspartyl-tRNA synthetase [Candidatus Jorgensenbacteria bacterium GW2011_GWA1_48_11]|uniref:Aspartate--tRNA(Asp/Asn) ligase n=1 Tax=Candidatus Jorgensenbacteria bacterium GW2011_GWA1_48_11 TaxID=1618660 RepID=A0A0G1U9X6_9BACT|nr:MAG: Aspartyl-tRNA synthetase [Candidatus Jorgensenbacteria bacterium GW2011_GWA1_48_11]KKW12342.1 MAG: Aspartyl-tRNA synthetase [Candidatus Jorgensenbacteria bacterium GW2011_GWB1_49_9]
MARVLTKDIEKFEGKEIELAGWVETRRDHGKLIFIDFRDRSGLAQVVFADKALHEKADSLRSEFVIDLKGEVRKRPKGMENSKIPSGHYEISAKNLEILAKAETPPFDVATGGLDVSEEVRMKYRYLDLRRPRLQKNIRHRSRLINFIRSFLDNEEFTEIETPILGKSTPEGARDYLVPARLHPGKFYALPQAPQQYKQLMMVAGFERYYQIARCFRDEDTRGDRQPEFTQLDLEMSFVKREDVMELNEKLLIAIIQKLYPEKKIQEIPFPRLTYEEVVKKYGNDRPDLRKDKNDPNLLAFCWIIDFPFFERVEPESKRAHPELVEGSSGSGSTGSPQTSKEVWTFTHNPFSAPKDEFMADLLAQKNIPKIIASQYDIALNGWEIGGGSIRNHKPNALKAVLSIMGMDDKKINENFGHMLQAFSFGTPPHGGIAWGLDRLVMILENEPNIREVIALPKTGDGRDLMTEAPSEVSKGQLKELHLKIGEKD